MRSPTRRSSIYGDGSQRRDFTYVDDAVDAFLLAARATEAAGRVYNLGGDGHVSLLELAETAHRGRRRRRVSGSIPFPADRKAIDIGDFYADYSAIERELGWRPRGRARGGLARTLDYYREHGDALRGGRVRVPYLDLTRETAALRDELGRRDRARARQRPLHPLARRSSASRQRSPTTCGAAHAVGVASGTDAITIALLRGRRRARRRGDHGAEHVRSDDRRDRARRRDAGARRRRPGDATRSTQRRSSAA